MGAAAPLYRQNSPTAITNQEPQRLGIETHRNTKNPNIPRATHHRGYARKPAETHRTKRNPIETHRISCLQIPKKSSGSSHQPRSLMLLRTTTLSIESSQITPLSSRTSVCAVMVPVLRRYHSEMTS